MTQPNNPQGFPGGEPRRGADALNQTGGLDAQQYQGGATAPGEGHVGSAQDNGFAHSTHAPAEQRDHMDHLQQTEPHGTVSESDLSYARYQTEDRSIGEIAGDLMDNASTLIRQEVALAKAEVQQSIGRVGAGAGMFAGAAVAALMMLFALTLTLWWAIAVAIGSVAEPALGLSGVIVTVIWAVIAGILAMVGKSQFDKMKGLEKTQETITKIPNAVTGHEEKNR